MILFDNPAVKCHLVCIQIIFNLFIAIDQLLISYLNSSYGIQTDYNLDLFKSASKERKDSLKDKRKQVWRIKTF